MSELSQAKDSQDPQDALVKFDGNWLSVKDARELALDKMTFGIGYLKATGEMHDGEPVYQRIPVSEVQGEWYSQFEERRPFVLFEPAKTDGAS